MRIRWGPIVVILGLVGGGALVLAGDADPHVSLGAVLEVWADVLRDADQFGLRLTRVADAEEMRIGRELAQSVLRGQREDPEWTAYVAAVGAALTPHARRTGIRYELHALDAPRVQAFALPGGQVFITRGMLERLGSEAELATILGHEIAHIDLRHAIERVQHQHALAAMGRRDLGLTLDLVRRLVATGYTQYQELDADALGLRLAARAGYDPAAATAVTRRFARREPATPRPPATPVAELGQALGEALGTYGRSHPPSRERARRLDALLARERGRLTGREVYGGAENLRRRVPRSQLDLPAERRRV